MGNIAERRMQPPAVGVSVVILALGPETADEDLLVNTGSSADASKTDNADKSANAPESADGRAPGSKLWIPLVRRVRQPYLGNWALPGGGLRADRSLEQCAYRALETTTDLHPDYLEQLYTFGDPERSRGGLPMISIVYWAMIGHAQAGDFRDGDNVRWFPEDVLPQLAFDHRRIVDYALWRMRDKIEYSDIATRLVGDTFTLRQLRRVYEAVSGQPIDAANFRRRMLSSGQLEDTGAKLREGRHRPAAVYRYKPDRRHRDGLPFDSAEGSMPYASASHHSVDIDSRSPLEEAMAVLMPSAMP